MTMLKPLTSCGGCKWTCRECGQTWTCIEEGYCRVAALTMCRPCWAVESKRFMEGNND